MSRCNKLAKDFTREKVSWEYLQQMFYFLVWTQMSGKQIGPSINPTVEKYGLLSLHVLYEQCLHLCSTQLQILKE